MAQNVHLLIIDPQNDFCDPVAGTLFVPGADEDMARLARFVDRIAPFVDDVHVTLDSHHPIDVAHPAFWRDAAGNPPAPFTQISFNDVESGRWTTTLPAARPRALRYLRQLQEGGRYPHVIWPPHCLIGSKGHNVVPVLFDALRGWEERRFALVDYVTKGSNVWTEHFSAVQAEVPDPADPDTQINARLIETLEQADLIVLAGEAGSHCLANTVRDVAAQFSDPAYVRKMVLLTDATSPVPGFEALQDAFLQDMTAAGMQLSTTRDFVSRFV
jgi:nicotinamidase-related amidase